MSKMRVVVSIEDIGGDERIDMIEMRRVDDRIESRGNGGHDAVLLSIWLI